MKTEIKGIVASTGNGLKSITGVAKLVLSEKDFSKVKKDNILIAKETNAGFLPVMLNAKAIITDLGGILCHAAIVARELKIPCVVGTKIATQVLKNGDKIEIDIKSGTVKIQ